MVKVPKWFEKHFWAHLIQKDFMPDWDSSWKVSLRIAWRAYTLGRQRGIVKGKIIEHVRVMKIVTTLGRFVDIGLQRFKNKQ